MNLLKSFFQFRGEFTESLPNISSESYSNNPKDGRFVT